MKILIAGGGKVGAALTRHLSGEDHDLTIIDTNKRVLSELSDIYDVMTLQGNCACLATLRDAGAAEAELLIAATNADEINLLACITARSLNPRIHTIARIRNPEYAEQVIRMREMFGLSMIINPERQAASEIDRLIRFPGFLKRDSFAKGRVAIVEVRVEKGAKLEGVRLADLGSVVHCRVLVCAVLREGEVIIPSGSFRMEAGDRVFVTAPTPDLTVLLKSLGIITHKVRRVLVSGGGRVSYYLAKKLTASGISCKIIEKDEDRCRELAELLPEADIICGDACDQSLLDSEDLTNADALVTATGMDELNMITSLFGHVRGIPQIITKVSHVEGSRVLEGLPIGSVVCPKELTSDIIVRYVRAIVNGTGAAVSLHFIADGQAEAIEFRVDANTPYQNTPLRKTRLKKNVLLASIIRGMESEIPGGDSMYSEGDTVLVVTDTSRTISKLADIFE